MYDANKLQERMAEKGLNFKRVARRAKVDPKTAKSVVTTGKGHPESVRAVAKALGFTLSQIVIRRKVA